jgi:hypothetical protein
MKPVFFLISAALLINACAEPVSEDDIKKLETAPVMKVNPTDELASIFFYGTDSTDLQRSAKLEELANQYVKWQLTIAEIKKITDSRYLVVTGRDPEITAKDGVLTIKNAEAGVRATVWILSENDKKHLLGLKTGSEICLKGRLTGTDTLRHLNMRPAILCTHDKSP